MNCFRARAINKNPKTAPWYAYTSRNHLINTRRLRLHTTRMASGFVYAHGMSISIWMALHIRRMSKDIMTSSRYFHQDQAATLSSRMMKSFPQSSSIPLAVSPHRPLVLFTRRLIPRQTPSRVRTDGSSPPLSEPSPLREV